MLRRDAQIEDRTLVFLLDQKTHELCIRLMAPWQRPGAKGQPTVTEPTFLAPKG